MTCNCLEVKEKSINLVYTWVAKRKYQVCLVQQLNYKFCLDFFSYFECYLYLLLQVENR